MDNESDSIKLIREAIRTRDAPSIPKYRDDLVKNTIVEINSLSTLIPAKSTAASNTIKSAFLQRRKRCILAYQRERLNRYKELLWLSGATTSSTLPENSYHAASSQELLFIKEYQDLVSTWKGLWLDVDVGASITPPKDVFVEIRVIQDCGEVIKF
jgi:GINS complex subunit 1